MGLRIGKIYKSKFYLTCAQDFDTIKCISDNRSRLVYTNSETAKVIFSYDYAYYSYSKNFKIELIEGNTNIIVLETKGKYIKVLQNGKVGWIVFSEKHGLEKVI